MTYVEAKAMSEVVVDDIIALVEDVLIRYAPDGTVEWASPSTVNGV